MPHLDKPHLHPICPTCQSDLTGREELKYFAQAGTALETDDISGWWDDLNRLLNFSCAVFDALYQLADHSDNRPEDETNEQLAGLGWELMKEIDRRTRGLYNAGRIWKERATTKEEG